MVMLTVKPSLIAETSSMVIINEVAEEKTSDIARRSETTVDKQLCSQQPAVLKLSPELRSQIHPTRLPKEFIFTVLKGKNGQESRLMKVESRIPQTSEEYPPAIEANKPLRRLEAFKKYLQLQPVGVQLKKRLRSGKLQKKRESGRIGKPKSGKSMERHMTSSRLSGGALP